MGEVNKDDVKSSSLPKMKMHLHHRKTQHCETCCVTHCVTCSHRTVTCKRDDVWETWYCPATVYCTRISPVFSEVMSPNCAKTSRDVKPQKRDSLRDRLWQIWYYLFLPKARAVIRHYDRKYFQETLTKYSSILQYLQL